jgi:hypothetical protein
MNFGFSPALLSYDVHQRNEDDARISHASIRPRIDHGHTLHSALLRWSDHRRFCVHRLPCPPNSTAEIDADTRVTGVAHTAAGRSRHFDQLWISVTNSSPWHDISRGRGGYFVSGSQPQTPVTAKAECGCDCLAYSFNVGRNNYRYYDHAGIWRRILLAIKTSKNMEEGEQGGDGDAEEAV